MTEQQLQQLIERRSAGEVTFKEFLDELMNNGITKYEIHVQNGFATYMGKDYHLQVNSPFQFEVASEFNGERVVEAIRNIALPFPEFLAEISLAGVERYVLYILENKTVYYGKNGEEVEEEIQL